jgi:uncharacterized protein YkwD
MRQTAFGIAFSALVLASGLTTNPVPGQTSATKPIYGKSTSSSSNRVASSTFNTNDLEKSVFDRINQYRVSKGLSKLTLDSKISKRARTHSQNMASGKIVFSHHGFEKRVKSIPIRFQSASENVAFNQGYPDPAQEAVSGWIKSPGHLTNLKGSYNLTGIGVAANNQGEVYLTQIFLRSR